MSEDIQKHSVHTLVFRSIKRTHDMFLADNALAVPQDSHADDLKSRMKVRAEYALPGSNIQKAAIDAGLPGYQDANMKAIEGPKGQLAITAGPHSHMNGSASSSLTADKNANNRQPSADAIEKLAKALMPATKQNIEEQKQPAAPQEPTKGLATTNQQAANTTNNRALAVLGESKVPFSQGIVARKAPTMPKPNWHAPWKLAKVISGHTGWVRCVAFEPANQWFCTGAADRTIKIWDLATCQLKLSLTGHISTVRGLVVSNRHPYLFSTGEDKTVKCWDLEYNKVIRHYHGHLSAVYSIDIHPTIDVLLTAGRDSTARVWDIRTKACVHTLVGHTNTIADVKCQAAEPQVITGSHDSMIRYWDLAAGKSMATLTNHKKSIRALALHPTQYTMASASADNIKQWKFPDGNFMQNLGGHNAIINCLAVNSDGVLVSGGDNGSMYFWDWKTGYNFQRHQAVVQPGSLDSEAGMFAMGFDHSGTRLVTTEADKTIKIYKEDDTATEETHPVNWRPEIIKRKKY